MPKSWPTALLGNEPALEAVGRLLLQRTGGNPFFFEESVRSLVETGVLQGARGAYRLLKEIGEVEVPATVHAILAARIDRLPAEQKQLLQTAAVIGIDVPYALLLEIGGLPAEELRTVLNELQAAELVYESSLYPDLQYAFKHVLTHQVAYGSLLHQRRRALHVQILEAIKRVYAERIAEPVESLAHHALRGEVWEQAVQYLRQAGLKAFNRSANREAAVHLEQAIEALAHLPQTPQNVELAMDLRLLLRPALTALGEFVRAFELAREAEPLARAVGDGRREVLIQSFISSSLAHAGRLDEALAHAQAGMALAETLGDPALSLIARLYLGMAHMLCGEHRKALEFFERNSGLSVAEIVALHRAPVGPAPSIGHVYV